SGPRLTVDRAVIVEMVRLAAVEVPGVLRVGRAGPAWRRVLLGRSVRVRPGAESVDVRLWLVARPGQPLAPLARDVRAALGATLERLLGLHAGSVTVVVDGVGG
ncbi:MAG TPA: Asp23/Gls24 family envelope stress response protein, partial [Candidatus Dormibacteraeota bacterium]|nr:Asp23/Gls24 family envelope stress response protein [Candidatus Dormibacteraeota bacterium]